ncbi:MAG TPA: DUF2851 family protein [Prolixibacteraceae bacterium]|nr:DUF2851 family protein [Prolixibacteraceae bacterium]HPS11636.1 DUF2851 family protein [Prolixibacteraceae bacterium]
MSEEFLQFIWKNSLFPRMGLFTTRGEPVEIINPGKLNTDAGPDFFNASIRIGDTLWAGNVEIHLRSSDWLLHGHQNDLSYNNVILHVVLENDKEVFLFNGSPIQTLILPVKPEIRKNYQELMNEKDWPACHRNVGQVDEIFRFIAFDSLLIERIEQKTEGIVRLLAENKNDWSETFHQFLARNFGFKTNALPFEMLARMTPLSVLAKHKNNLFQLEAILFGQSGLLNEQLLGDDYFLKLRDEYSFLAKKHGLKGIDSYLWKFMRLRPANFPTIRIAQFAALIHRSESLLSKLTEEKEVKTILDFFDVKASEYWDTHYRFNQTATKMVKWMGKASRNTIIINTVVPFLFVYGERNNKKELKQRALDLLESLPPESNNIIKRWNELGIVTRNSSDTQALIQLKNEYCDRKKCLHCLLATKIIDR